MSREIKFRAWVNSNKMWNWNTLYACFECESNGQMPFNNFYNKSNAILMQFTGLKDKNDKEIFEGDILDVCNGSINGHEWKDKPYAVEYKPQGFDICMFCWNENGESIMDNTHWCEVIGNIYENTELLSE